ncbi:ParB family chromosome partitioning protein [Ochrobactrum sp. BH3]|nr:ParB family chromosome partitioning protein [Ochrobactrum sp. BH3]
MTQTQTQATIEAFIVPLNKLERDPLNVRKTYSNDGIEELAATIRADNYRLLQNLVVRKADKKGLFLVTAGGRRLAALKLLCEAGEIANNYGVECKERDATDATEISLIENVIREDMHPVDQFEAFRVMADEGKTVSDIAARFGKTVSFIRGRMALARVSPILLDLYRKEEMNFEQLTAFTLSDDHEKQVNVWESLPYWNTGADSIRRALQSDSITNDNKRMRFIGGMEVYEAAGGAVKRDLFDDEHSGYATNAALVEKLVADKLQGTALSLLKEGWKWAECVESLPSQAHRMERVYPSPVALGTEQQAELETLEAELAEVTERLERNEATDEDHDRFDALETGIQALRDQGEAYAADDIKRSGCFVFMDHYGNLCIERGLIGITEQEQSEDQESNSNGNVQPIVASVNEPAFKLSAALVQELSAQKTAAIRAELAHNPEIALASVVYTSLLPFFVWNSSEESCLELRVTSEPLHNSIKDAGEVKALQTLDALKETYGDTLPGTSSDLWDWCLNRNQSELLNLLVFAAAQSINAVEFPHYERRKQRNHADKLAQALGMDMKEWFTPTAANYFSRISKTGIEQALTESKGADFAEGVSSMKKADAAAYAERQIAGTSWLPEQMRLAEAASVADTPDDYEEQDDYNGDLVEEEFSEAAE